MESKRAKPVAFALAALTLAGVGMPVAPGHVRAGEPGASVNGRDPRGTLMSVSPIMSTPRYPMSHAGGTPLVEQLPSRSADATADLVVIVSMDGLRPDAIDRSTPELYKLMLRGVSPHYARTIDKSSTLPSHASMMSGFEPDDHGLRFNSYRPARGHIHVPTVFSLASEVGMPTWMFVGKKKLKHLLSDEEESDFEMSGIFCRRVVKHATPTLRNAKKGVVFVHFADPDSAGHRHGWMTEEYHTAVRRSDGCLGRVVDTLKARGDMDRTLLLVTSDHGGHGRSHGTRLKADQRIPWIAWGAGANARRRVRRTVHTTDTAATALSALGITLPEGIHGQPVTEALGEIQGPPGMPFVGEALE